MARIRTVKPELFKHEGLYDLELETGLPIRLAFIGLFTCCDRQGRFKWIPRRLKIDVLPHDNIDFSRVLDALATRGFVCKYASNGEEFGHIPSFPRHQVINNRESQSELPDPEECLLISTTSTRELRVNDACATPLVQDQEEGKGREGKGRGKEGKELSTPDGASLVFSHWQSVMNKPRSVLDKKRLALINARLKDGYSVDDLKDAATGCSLSPFHMGMNDQGRRYDAIELIYRDAGKVDQFIAFKLAPPKQMTPAELRSAINQKQLDEWASDGDFLEGDFENA